MQLFLLTIEKFCNFAPCFKTNNMRKNILTIACMAITLISTSCKAQDNRMSSESHQVYLNGRVVNEEGKTNVQLPKPSMDNSVTLMQSLQNRHSSRQFADKDIPDDVLSTVLWAACGINRPESGKITAPSAINAQDIIVYVVRKDGAYRYEPKDNVLAKVSGKDLRSLVAGRQSFAADAPVSLVLVSDHGKFGGHSNGASRMGILDAGYVSENICLVCSALGLNTVPRMTMDTEGLKKELGLDDNYDFIVNSQIGYPKE